MMFSRNAASRLLAHIELSIEQACRKEKERKIKGAARIGCVPP
jgi:hypothetical protein